MTNLGDEQSIKERDNIFDLRFSSVSPIATTDSSDSISAPIKKQRFDDRAETRLSLMLQTGHTKPARKKVHKRLSSEESVGSLVKWADAQEISQYINSDRFISQFGQVVVLRSSPVQIIMGTAKGYLVGFNYRQELEFTLVPWPEEEDEEDDERLSESIITSIASSPDSLFVAAGYSNGKIILWDLSKSNDSYCGPSYIIKPVTGEERLAENKEGHLIGVPITSVQFLYTSNLQILTCDESGLVIYSHGFTRLLKKYFKSQKVIGKDNAQRDNIVHSCEILPMGDSHQITDQLVVAAVITNKQLSIFSVLSLNDPSIMNLRSHCNLAKPKNIPEDLEFSACLSWYPCMNEKNEIINARLAFSWCNTLSVVEIENDTLPSNLLSVIADLKEKDKAISTIPIGNPTVWSIKEKANIIIDLKWLSPSLLVVFSKDTSQGEVVLSILHYTKLGRRGRISSVGSQSIKELGASLGSIIGNSSWNYSYTNIITLLKRKFIIMFDSGAEMRLSIGRPLNWAERLMSHLSEQDYASAFMLAADFYNSSDVGKGALFGFPKDPVEKKNLIRPYLTEILKTSSLNLFNEEATDKGFYLNVFFSLIGDLKEDHPSEDYDTIVEQVYESLDNDDLFFRTVEPYILSERITVFTPTVLKNLINFYIDLQRRDLFTQIICLLDVASLDIDLTISLCVKYNLRDCLIYIWNTILNDYLTPLMQFIEEIVESNNKASTMTVFAYMSFVLTGRQYPTSRFINPEKELEAKKAICDVLFSSRTLEWPRGSSNFLGEDGIFPYLHLFLNYNSFELLSTLNEFFEDSLLNEDVHLNRQYIIEALLDVFEEGDFKEGDFEQLSIFIARNYPKYCQFIRISDSVVEKVTESLCSSANLGTRRDRELALQSIIPYVERENNTYLIQQLKAAKFFDVLISIYVMDGEKAKAIATCLLKEQENDPKDNELQSNFFSSYFSEAFQTCKSKKERSELISVIEKNFETLASKDTRSFANVVSKYVPELHKHVLLLDEREVVQNYMKAFFEIYKTEKSTAVDKIYPDLVSRYVENDQNDVQFIKDHVDVLSEDNERFYHTVEVLKEAKAIESLVILYIHKGEYKTALAVVVQNIRKISEDSLTQEDTEKFQWLLGIGMKVSESLDARNMSSPDKELNLSEWMWLELIETSVSIANSREGKDRIIFNNAVYTCFRRISVSDPYSSERRDPSFLLIFNKFLTSSTETAVLSNIRSILQDVFISYYYETEMHKLSLKMLDYSIYKSMVLVRLDNARGWDIKSKTCASCGKKLWGSTINESHYDAWEDRQWLILHPKKPGPANIVNAFEKEISLDRYHQLGLVFFKCTHGYHIGCLENLGFQHNRECVLCVKEPQN